MNRPNEKDQKRYGILKAVSDETGFARSGQRPANPKTYLAAFSGSYMQAEVERPPVRWTIIVNAREYPWNKKKISYTEVVDLPFPPPHKETEIFTVQYSHGPKENPEGTLVKGKSVSVEKGMVFDVTRTDKS